MSSDTKKPDTKTDENTKAQSPDDTPEGESIFRKVFNWLFPGYLREGLNTEIFVMVLFGIIFIYFFLNNYRFNNGKKGWLGWMGLIVLILFYGTFATTLYYAYSDMVKEGKKKDKSYTNANIAIGTFVTIVVMCYSLYAIPFSMTNAGVIAKGLLRVWNPFHDLFPNVPTGETPKETSGGGLDIDLNTLKTGYDNKGLFWGNQGFLSNLGFYILSFPLILANYFAGSWPFNYYLIPTIAGDGSSSGDSWTIHQNIPDKNNLLSWLIFIILFLITLPYRFLNWISYLITKKNFIYENFNPIDWDVMKKAFFTGEEGNSDNKNIGDFISKIYFGIDSKYINGKVFGFWLNIYIMIMIVQVVMGQLLFPSMSGISTAGNTAALVVFGLIALGFIVQMIRTRDKKRKMNFLNLRTSGFKAVPLNKIRETFAETAKNTLPGFPFLRAMLPKAEREKLTPEHQEAVETARQSLTKEAFGQQQEIQMGQPVQHPQQQQQQYSQQQQQQYSQQQQQQYSQQQQYPQQYSQQQQYPQKYSQQQQYQQQYSQQQQYPQQYSQQQQYLPMQQQQLQQMPPGASPSAPDPGPMMKNIEKNAMNAMENHENARNFNKIVKGQHNAIKSSKNRLEKQVRENKAALDTKAQKLNENISKGNNSIEQHRNVHKSRAHYETLMKQLKPVQEHHKQLNQLLDKSQKRVAKTQKRMLNKIKKHTDVTETYRAV